MRSVLALLVCTVLMEVGWLALWPVSSILSHSSLFTSTLLASHPTLHAFAQVLPGWSDGTLTDPPGSPVYMAPAAVFATLLLAFTVVYAVALLILERGAAMRAASLWVIAAGTLIFQATLAAMPGLFSQDVFSYIAYGRLSAEYGLNPYIWPPSVLRDPVVQWVADVWRTYPAPYGPLWLDLQWLQARLTEGMPLVDQALVYRGLANILLLVNLALAWRLLGRLTPLHRSQRVTALAALAWNPLVLFETAGNAHNDVLMVTFTLLALVLFQPASEGIWATVALSLATLVKYLSGIGLIWLGLAAASRARGWFHRHRRLVALAALSIALAVAIAAPWLELPDSLDPLLNETARVGYVNSLPDALVSMLVNAAGAPLEPARAAERVLVITVFAAYLLWEVRQVWCEPTRGTIARALARSSLLYILLVSTSVQTWYFCLPVSVALALGWRRRITQLCLAYSALALPALYLNYYLRDLTPGWVFIVYACAPLLVLTRHRLTLLQTLRPSVRPSTAVAAPAPRGGSSVP